MIEVIVNRPSFEYDIHSLVKAFFSTGRCAGQMYRIHLRIDTGSRMTVQFTDETGVHFP